MKIVGFSQKGRKSELNEDALLILSRQNLFVIADGVGGGPSGHAASRAFVDTCLELSKKNRLTPESVENFFQSANGKVHSLAAETGQKGMATTLVSGLIMNDELHVFHAGDSRAYLLRDEKLTQLTIDHSKIVQREGNVEKALVTRAIGVRLMVEIEHNKFHWDSGDVLLLVSDGISDALAEQEIITILNDQTLSLFDKARVLCRDAEAKGGQDDKTVIVAAAN